ncbi:CTLH/CRA C-terminal to lish motif domain-containing protein [Dipodascopsis tothii]|uniref:CTLH/CRA C-terminal to lish motif domain-containing protein n=1 Tax=Dipodascopsis tothii TaxID=44089 RepID=UPI0034CD7A18
MSATSITTREDVAERRTYSREEWDRKLDAIPVSRADLNSLVMNYLIIEGYQSAAYKFAQEANISATGALDSINARVQIRAAVHAGDIQTAIEKINDLNPELLDTNPELHFALLRLQLIELIKQCLASPTRDIQPALSFGMSHLASRAQKNPAFLADLEKTMALLCFSPENLAPPLAELLNPELRWQVAAKVNEAMLEAQGVMKEAKLWGLVRVWGWGENALKAEKTVDFPSLEINDMK